MHQQPMIRCKLNFFRHLCCSQREPCHICQGRTILTGPQGGTAGEKGRHWRLNGTLERDLQREQTPSPTQEDTGPTVPGEPGVESLCREAGKMLSGCWQRKNLEPIGEYVKSQHPSCLQVTGTFCA